MKPTFLIATTLLALLTTAHPTATALAQTAIPATPRGTGPTAMPAPTPKKTAAPPLAASMADRAYPLQANNRYRFYTRSGQLADATQYRSVVSLSDPDAPEDGRGYIGLESLPEGAKALDVEGEHWRFIRRDGAAAAMTYLYFDRGYLSPSGFLTGIRAGKVYLIDPVTGAEVSEGYDTLMPLSKDLKRFFVQDTRNPEPDAILDLDAGIIARFPEGAYPVDLHDGTYALCVRKDGPEANNAYALANPEDGTLYTDYLYKRVVQLDMGVSRLVAQDLDGRYGLVDARGVAHIDFLYDSLYGVGGDRFTISLGEREGLMDGSGREILPLEPGSVSVFGEFIVRVEKNAQRIYDREGKLLATEAADAGVSAVFAQLPEGGNTARYMRLMSGEIPRYMDAQGRDVPAFRGLNIAEELRPGVVLAQEGVGQAMGLRTADGKWLIEPEYVNIQWHGDVPQPYYSAWAQNRSVTFDERGHRIYPNPRFTGRVAQGVYAAAYGAAYGLADAEGKWIVKRSRFDDLED